MVGRAAKGEHEHSDSIGQGEHEHFGGFEQGQQEHSDGYEEGEHEGVDVPGPADGSQDLSFVVAQKSSLLENWRAENEAVEAQRL